MGICFKKAAALKELQELDISEEAYNIVSKVGIKRITQLVREDMLLAQFEHECYDWVNNNKPLKLSMADVACSYLHDYTDVGSMLKLVDFSDMMSLIGTTEHDNAPKLVQAVIDEAENDPKRVMLEDHSFMGVAADYLNEISEYIRYASFY